MAAKTFRLVSGATRDELFITRETVADTLASYVVDTSLPRTLCLLKHRSFFYLTSIQYIFVISCRIPSIDGRFIKMQFGNLQSVKTYSLLGLVSRG